MVAKLMKGEKIFKGFKDCRNLYPFMVGLYKRRSLSADVTQVKM
jgi:hypothetical protein